MPESKTNASTQTLPLPPADSYYEIPIFINGEETAFKGLVPHANRFNPFLPLRKICEHFGADVGWNGATQQISITEHGQQTLLSTKSDKAYINGVDTQLSYLPFIRDGATYVPPNFLAKVLGVDIDAGHEGPSGTQVNITAGRQRHAEETPFLILDKNRYYHRHLQDSKNEGIPEAHRIKHAQEALDSQNLAVLFEANLGLSHLVSDPNEASQYYRAALGFVRNSDQKMIMENYKPTKFSEELLKTSKSVKKDNLAYPIKRLAQELSHGR